MVDSYLCFWLPFFIWCLTYFFLYQSLFWSLWTVFDALLSNIKDVPSMNQSANAFIFGDFNIHHKEDWLTYYGRTGRHVNCYRFSISSELSQVVNFPAQIPGCDSHSPALLDIFLSSDPIICSLVLFPHLKILSMLLNV